VTHTCRQLDGAKPYQSRQCIKAALVTMQNDGLFVYKIDKWLKLKHSSKYTENGLLTLWRLQEHVV